MFTRRGDQQAARQLPDQQLAQHKLQNQQLTEMQIEQARAAASPIRLAAAPPHDTMTAAMMMSPPPIPAPLGTPSSDLHRSVIGEDLTIEGQAITIRCKGELEINGNIQAELHSQRLMVGKSGRVEGTISADNVEVWGHVSGTIKGARVSLHPGAEVEGDILSRTLSVADGASFEGRSRKVVDLEQIAPQLVSAIKPKPADAPIDVPLPQARTEGAIG